MTMQAPAAPFRLGTRQLIEHVATRDWAASTRLDFELKKVGYLAGLLVRVTGTWTVGAATPDERPGFPYNIVRQFVLNVPGLAHPVQLSGYQAKLQMLAGRPFAMHSQGFDRVASAIVGQANAHHDADLDDQAVITTGGARDVDLWFYISTTRNARDLRGLLPIGGDQDTMFEVHCGALGDIFDATAQITATDLDVELYQVFYTPPVAGFSAPDVSWAVVYDEYTQAITATGDVNIEIPRDGVILNVIHALWIDDDLFPAAPEASIESLSLRVNRDRLLDGLPYVAWAKLQAMRADRPFPAGVIVYDFDYNAADLPFVEAGQERGTDWLLTQGVTEIESRIRVAAAATLDSAKVVTSVKRLMRI